MSKYDSIVFKKVYHQCHSLSFSLSVYQLIGSYFRAVVSGPPGQAAAGLVLGLSKQYMGLEVVKNV